MSPPAPAESRGFLISWAIKPVLAAAGLAGAGVSIARVGLTALAAAAAADAPDAGVLEAKPSLFRSLRFLAISAERLADSLAVRSLASLSSAALL